MFEWAVLGSGYIARQFIKDLQLAPDQRVSQIYSNSRENAQEIVKDLGLTDCDVLSYENFGNSSDFNAVYIGNNTNRHIEFLQRAARSFFPVLCEKPIVSYSENLEAVLAEFEARKVLVMEGIWTLYLPQFSKLKDITRSNNLGNILKINTVLSKDFDFDKQLRVFDKSRQGGIINELAIYPIAICYELLGMPDSIDSEIELFGDIDVALKTEFRYFSDVIVKIDISLTNKCQSFFEIIFEKGSVCLLGEYFKPCQLQIRNNMQEIYMDFSEGYNARGLIEEALEFEQLLHRNDLKEFRKLSNQTRNVHLLLSQIAEIGFKKKGLRV